MQPTFRCKYISSSAGRRCRRAGVALNADFFCRRNLAQFSAIYLGRLEASLVLFIRNFMGLPTLGMGTGPDDASVGAPGSLGLAITMQ
jgi:hypothetical protein